MSLSLIVTKHAVDKYRIRASEDLQSPYRSDSEIKKIIAHSLKQYKGYNVLAGLVHKGPGLEMHLELAFGENGRPITKKHELIMRNSRIDEIKVVTLI